MIDTFSIPGLNVFMLNGEVTEPSVSGCQCHSRCAEMRDAAGWTIVRQVLGLKSAELGQRTVTAAMALKVLSIDICFQI